MAKYIDASALINERTIFLKDEEGFDIAVVLVSDIRLAQLAPEADFVKVIMCNENQSYENGYADGYAAAASEVKHGECDGTHEKHTETHEAQSKQYETCKLYNAEKDECYAARKMHCKSGHCKLYIDKSHKGWGQK